MKYMTGKAKMMVTGIALGTVAAGGMAALIAAGKVGVAGSLVVVFLMDEWISCWKGEFTPADHCNHRAYAHPVQGKSGAVKPHLNAAIRKDAGHKPG